MSNELADEYFGFVEDIFQSKEVFKKYWDEFLKLEDRAERVTFLKVCQNIALIKQFDKNEIPTHEFIDFIMLTSIIELLQTTTKYQTFDEWLETVDKSIINAKKCKSLLNDYNKIHGCSGKFRRFFIDYLDDEEKISLLGRIKISSDNTSSNGKIVAFCYLGNICDSQINESWCNIEVERTEGPIVQDKRKLKKSLTELCNFLYEMRNQFVHAGRIPIFPTANVNFVSDFYETRIYKGVIINELTIEFLYSLVAKYLSKLLDSYLGKSKRVISFPKT